MARTAHPTSAETAHKSNGNGNGNGHKTNGNGHGSGSATRKSGYHQLKPGDKRRAKQALARKRNRKKMRRETE